MAEEPADTKDTVIKDSDVQINITNGAPPNTGETGGGYWPILIIGVVMLAIVVYVWWHRTATT